MKLLNIIAWISAAIAIVIILVAAFTLVTQKSIGGFHQTVNFFHAANSFLLLAIVFFIADKKS